MARKKKIHRKKMTITQQFNRYAIGLQFFGESIATKKRATRKALNEIKKFYSKLRKALKLENPSIELPTIAQAYKYVREEQEQEVKPIEAPTPAPTVELEPLPYDHNIPAEIDSYDIINQFRTAIEEGITTARRTYFSNDFYNVFASELTDMLALFDGAVSEYGEDYVANYLSNSKEFDRFMIVNYYDYEEAGEIVSDMHESIEAMINEMRNENAQDIDSF